MSAPQQSNLRWIALLLALAVVASAAITYALVLLTSPTGRDDAISPTDTSNQLLSNNSDVSSDGAPDSATGPVTSSTPPSAPTTTTPMTPASTTHTDADETSSTASGPPTSTATSVLEGSGVTLPAAWTGTAKVTVTVRGECATTTPSVYTDVPADLALDLSQNEPATSNGDRPATVPHDIPTLTLGVNANELPRIAVYSAIIDETGRFQEFWRLSLTEQGHVTHVHATLRSNADSESNPNTLADSETSLQPCESSDTVPVPRVLAPGSTLDGWISATQAQLNLTATTTDGKRAVTVEFTALRK